MKWFFFISLFGSVYSYFLYPLLLRLTPAKAIWDKGHSRDFTPDIDLIITVHNEESRIREKLENALQLEYPAQSINIVVASDGSTDKTNQIVSEYADRSIKLVDVQDRKGKENAQLRAIEATDSSIIIFSDVATQMPPDSVRLAVAPFANEKIGAVSSEDRFISDAGTVAGEGLYVKYEMMLRRLESERAGLVGLSGSFFAARREVCENWDISSPSDFNTALNCNERGKISISSPEVLGYYKDLQDPGREYQRKVRTVLRGITALMRNLNAMNIAKRGTFAFQVFSHKAMRWLVPWFLVSLFFASAALYAEHGFYQLAFWSQCLFYSIALIGWKFPPARKNALVKIIFFFVQVNISIAHATLKYLAGSRMTVWSPSQR